MEEKRRYKNSNKKQRKACYRKLNSQVHREVRKQNKIGLKVEVLK